MINAGISQNRILVTTMVAVGALASPAMALSPPTAPVPVVATASVTGSHSDSSVDERHVKNLHDQLSVTPAQEPLWSDVVAVMAMNDKKLDEMTAERHRLAPSLTAVQDLESYSAITEAHGAAIKAFVVPFSKLYAVMTPEQQKVADHLFRGDGKHAKKTI